MIPSTFISLKFNRSDVYYNKLKAILINSVTQARNAESDLVCNNLKTIVLIKANRLKYYFWTMQPLRKFNIGKDTFINHQYSLCLQLRCTISKHQHLKSTIIRLYHNKLHNSRDSLQTGTNLIVLRKFFNAVCTWSRCDFYFFLYF